MLPHSLRTRVFEPAYYDLLSEYGPRSQKRIGFGLQVLGLTFNSYRVGGPRMVLEFVRSQTPAAWAVAGIVGLMALFVAVQYVLRAGGAYGE